MDEELRRRARAARSEIEAQVDIDAELAGRPVGPTTSGIVGITPLPPRGRIVAVTGSIAAVAVAIVGGVVLLRGPESIETSEPSAPIAVVDTTTTTFAPSTDPETTSPVPTTTIADTSAEPTTTIVPATTTTTSTTAPSTTTSTTALAPTTTIPVPAAVPWRTLPSEDARIDWNCRNDDLFEDCTQLLIGRDGTPVTYDPTTRTLIRHSTPPVETTLPASIADDSFLSHLGPDNVVYLSVHHDPQGELSIDVVAVTLAPDDAGRELSRWTDIKEISGDSELVATPDGLVALPCCGPEIERPVPGAPVLVPWLGRDGQDTRIDGPAIRFEVDYPRLTIHRDDGGTRSWTVEPGGDWLARGIPSALPTFDGGFVAWTSGSNVVVLRGWVDGTVSTVTLDDSIVFVTLDPSGRFLIPNDDTHARVEPFAERAEFWAGRREVADDGSVTLPDIDIAIDGGAAWATDPVAFGNAVAGRPEVNELRTVESTRLSESEFLVTVTSSNLFDDSGFAVRLELTLGRDDDGHFRFMSGKWAQACQPGRGHQDFSTEPCV